MIRYVAKNSAKIAGFFTREKTVVKQAALVNATGLSFIVMCTSALEMRGLEEKNLYRLSASTLKVNTLLQKGLSPPGSYILKLHNRRKYPTNVITSAVKQYLRNLPEPLFTYALYDRLLNSCRNPSREFRLNQITVLIHQLPPMNFLILKTLTEHLARVASYSHLNNMTAENLAACFGPTLVRPLEAVTDPTGADIKLCNIILETLIQNTNLIFGQSNEVSFTAEALLTDVTSGMHFEPTESMVTLPPSTPRGSLDNQKQEDYSESGTDPETVSEDENKNTDDEFQGITPITKTDSPTVSKRNYSYSERAVALHSYAGYYHTDLEFKQNDILEDVHETSHPGWLEGTFNGGSGLIPAHFVKFIE